MATQAQVRANRRNAQKSTGPRTPSGKAAIAQNAIKHGLLAEQAVIRDEDPGEFESYREQFLADLHPAGSVESVLAERAVGLAWRLRRAERLQAQVIDALLAKDDHPISRLSRAMLNRNCDAGPDGPESALGPVVAKDFGGSRILDRLGLYERRIEYSLYKTLNELQRLRLLRELEAETEESASEPSDPPAPHPKCETKPISSATPAQNAPLPPRPNRQTPSDRPSGVLTPPPQPHTLVAMAMSPASAPPRRASGPPAWGLSSIGKEEPR